MKVSLLAGALALLGTAHGRSLSYRMKGSEQKACFYAIVAPNVDLKNALLQFYFSASDAKGTDVVYVDAEVQDAFGKQLYKQTKQTHAEVNIKPPQHGDYSLCLTHHGTHTEKNIDVDVTLPTAPAEAPKEDKAHLENTINKLHRELSDLVHTMRFIKTRERRNVETVETIGEWVWCISIFEVLLIIGMSILQITVLRMFFNGNKKYQRV